MAVGGDVPPCPRCRRATRAGSPFGTVPDREPGPTCRTGSAAPGRRGVYVIAAKGISLSTNMNPSFEFSTPDYEDLSHDARSPGLRPGKSALEDHQEPGTRRQPAAHKPATARAVDRAASKEPPGSLAGFGSRRRGLHRGTLERQLLGCEDPAGRREDRHRGEHGLMPWSGSARKPLRAGSP